MRQDRDVDLPPGQSGGITVALRVVPTEESP